MTFTPREMASEKYRWAEAVPRRPAFGSRQTQRELEQVRRRAYREAKARAARALDSGRSFLQEPDDRMLRRMIEVCDEQIRRCDDTIAAPDAKADRLPAGPRRVARSGVVSGVVVGGKIVDENGKPVATT